MSSPPLPPMLPAGPPREGESTIMPDPQNGIIPAPLSPGETNLGMVPDSVKEVPALLRVVLRSDCEQEGIGYQSVPVGRRSTGTGLTKGRGVTDRPSLIKTTRRRKSVKAQQQKGQQPVVESAGESNLAGHGGPVHVVSNAAPTREQDEPEEQVRGDVKGMSRGGAASATGEDTPRDGANAHQCFLCGTDTQKVLKRIQTATIEKFMKIPVSDNPFVSFDPENLPKHLVLCQKDKVWIENMWVSDRRFHLAGIWKRRDPLTGEVVSNERAKRPGSKKAADQMGNSQLGDALTVEKTPRAMAEKNILEKEGEIAQKTMVHSKSQALKDGADKAPMDEENQNFTYETISKAMQKRSRRAKSRTTLKRSTRLSNGGDKPTPITAPTSSRGPLGDKMGDHLDESNAVEKRRAPPPDGPTQSPAIVKALDPPRHGESDSNSNADSGLAALGNCLTTCSEFRDVVGPATSEDDPEEILTKRRRKDALSSDDQPTAAKLGEAPRTSQSELRWTEEARVCVLPVKKARSDTEMMRLLQQSSDFRSAVLHVQNETSALKDEISRMRLVMESHSSQLQALAGTIQSFRGGPSPTS